MKQLASQAALCCILAACVSVSVAAQQSSVHVEVHHEGKAIEGAQVTINGATYQTDAAGMVVAGVQPGTIAIRVGQEGFASANATVQVLPGQQQRVIIELPERPDLEDDVTVSATRTDRRLEDLPMRVEVLGREEIEEKMLMTPGDISMMLNEMGGLRVQATSPSLGAASVRIQGMRGRYTRFLSDGLPLFGDVGGLGLLQIPPMDLGQVEVIKGVASALHGAGAIGGVVNLISRRATGQPIGEVLLNRSTRGASDAVFFGAAPLNDRWRVSLLGGGHWHTPNDVDNDGWADLPRYARGIVRPRLFWDSGDGRTFFATVGATYEDRLGGTMPDAPPPAAITTAYREALETVRWDAGAVGQFLFRGRYVVTARAAVNNQRHEHRFGEVRERDRHRTSFGEIALRGAAGRHTWVVGGAAERDHYVPRDVPQFGYAFTIPGLFAQDDVELAEWLSVSASGRFDRHSEYGSFFSPRVSGLVHGGNWTVRVSGGAGFVGPTFLTEEMEGASLSRLTVPRRLVAERGRSGSLDVTRTIGVASMTVTLFASRIVHPIDVDRTEGFVLTNRSEPTTNTGLELLGTFRRAPLAVTASYTFVNARESHRGQRVDTPLTPRHSAGVVAMLEAEDVGRLGAEFYYTGRQRLEHNPYRAVSRSYVIVGFIAERRLGPARLFVNAENVGDARQTRWDPLLLPQRAADGRWTVDAWAPLDGRTFNGGIRFSF